MLGSLRFWLITILLLLWAAIAWAVVQAGQDWRALTFWGAIATIGLSGIEVARTKAAGRKGRQGDDGGTTAMAATSAGGDGGGRAAPDSGGHGDSGHGGGGGSDGGGAGGGGGDGGGGGGD